MTKKKTPKKKPVRRRKATVKKKEPITFFRKVSIVCGAILALAAVATLAYNLDCWNIRTYGDTAFATDVELAKTKVEIAAVSANQQYMTRQFEWRENYKWLQTIKAKYRGKQMPQDMRDQVIKTEMRQVELKRQMDKLEMKK